MDPMSNDLFGPPDDFGIPGGIFGVIDPEFCAALARVVMLGAAIENRLEQLLTQLKMPGIDDMIFDGPKKNVVYQWDYAGLTVKALVDNIRGALGALAPEYRHHIPVGEQ